MNRTRWIENVRGKKETRCNFRILYAIARSNTCYWLVRYIDTLYIDTFKRFHASDKADKGLEMEKQTNEN